MAFGNATGQGFVNRSVVTAQEVIIEGSKGRLLVYNGTPALGTLIASIAGQAGTDKYGNEYLQGVVSYQPGSPATAFALQAGQIQVYTGPGSGGPWTANGLFYQAALGELAIYSGVSGTVGDVGSSIIISSKDDSGGLAVVSGLDGQTYDTEQKTRFNTVAQTIISTSNTGITPMAFTVGPGTYRFEGIFRVKQGAVNASQLLGFTGPAVSFCVWYMWGAAPGGTLIMIAPSVFGSLAVQTITFGAANTEAYNFFKGIVTFTAAGTFQGAAAEGTNGDSFTIQPGSQMTLTPVIV